MSVPIPRITPDVIDPHFLDRYLMPSPLELYWADDFSPGFYAALAKAGFISVCCRTDEGPVLLPELQAAYAVLEWPDLRIPRNLRRKLSSGAWDAAGLKLAVTRNLGAVIAGVAERHGEENWLYPKYAAVLEALAEEETAGCAVRAVELRCADGHLVAGELGYAIGAVWTSLSGFSRRDGVWNQVGYLQLAALAMALRDAGFAWWNLGHPYMDYKFQIGAHVLDRADFIARWRSAVASEQPAGWRALNESAQPIEGAMFSTAFRT